jgi:uncharacterized protein involved in exopolysaccharide biosynthesis
MTQTSIQQQREDVFEVPKDEPESNGEPGGGFQESQRRLTEWLDMLWDERVLFSRVTAIGFLAATLIAFLIPKRYTTTTRLMPPDTQSASGMMMLAGLAQRAGNGLGAVAGDLLGMKSSGALFVGVLQSETVQNRLIEQFDLKKVYGTLYQQEARKKLGEDTFIQEERKSGIITITVTNKNAARAAGLANAYVKELNLTVSQLSTSSAHRERVFLEERLQTVKQDLDDADMQLAQFSSKNNTLDIQQQGKAMLEAAGTLAGQMIAAESELEGLRQIYSENNARIRALNARVGELRKELSKLSGKNGDAGNGASAATSADSSSGMPYPSLRKLPLLGVQYADYYRRAKIQETIYELLTEQYELTKVEEAKETPSIKVLDPAEIPERKSYPPRSFIIACGTLAVAALCTIWILISKRWQEASVHDPRKIFARKVFATLKSGIPVRGWSLERSRRNGE